MGIQGSGLHDPNARFRFLAVVFMGIVAFGSVLYWRQAELSNAEYVQIDTHNRHTLDNGVLRSKNYQLQVEDTSPSVK